MGIKYVEIEELKKDDVWISWSGDSPQYYEVGLDSGEIEGELHRAENNLAMLTLTNWSGDNPEGICNNKCLNVDFPSTPELALNIMYDYFQSKF